MIIFTFIANLAFCYLLIGSAMAVLWSPISKAASKHITDANLLRKIDLYNIAFQFNVVESFIKLMLVWPWLLYVYALMVSFIIRDDDFNK